MVAFFAGSVLCQTVNICGRVTDPNGNPLTHTVVRLGQATYDNGYGPAPYLVTTDAGGNYQLGTGACPPVNVIKEDRAGCLFKAGVRGWQSTVQRSSGQSLGENEHV